MDVSPISYNAHLLLGWSHGGNMWWNLLMEIILCYFFGIQENVLEIIFRDVSTKLVSGEMMELNIEIP